MGSVDLENVSLLKAGFLLGYSVPWISLNIQYLFPQSLSLSLSLTVLEDEKIQWYYGFPSLKELFTTYSPFYLFL